jgi:hypothetical protein
MVDRPTTRLSTGICFCDEEKSWVIYLLLAVVFCSMVVLGCEEYICTDVWELYLFTEVGEWLQWERLGDTQ